MVHAEEGGEAAPSKNRRALAHGFAFEGNLPAVLCKKILSSRHNHAGQVSSSNMRDRFLLQQQFGCLHASIAMKPMLDDIPFQKISQRKQAHPLMVGHPASHQLVTMLPESASGGAVVRGFVEPIAPEPSHLAHSPQIADGPWGISHQR